jgi:hypothetical protein
VQGALYFNNGIGRECCARGLLCNTMVDIGAEILAASDNIAGPVGEVNLN